MACKLWRPVPNYEGYYEVSNFGEIRSVDRTITYPDGKRYRKRGKVLARGKWGDVMLGREGSRRYFDPLAVAAAVFYGAPMPEGTAGRRQNRPKRRNDCPREDKRLRKAVYCFGWSGTVS